jgi:glycyl-tRNA synthetase
MPARSIEQVRNLCKRRGFVFPGSAAYGGLGSFWDYGPLGVEMLNNVKRAWWRDVVYKRDDVEGLDSAILMSRKVWQHSGHEATFSDPLVDCRNCRARFRADQIVIEALDVGRAEGMKHAHLWTRPIDRALNFAPDKFREEARRRLKDFAAKEAALQPYNDLVEKLEAAHDAERLDKLFDDPNAVRVVQEAIDSFQAFTSFIFQNPVIIRTAFIRAREVTCPKCGSHDFTEPRQFNLMFRTHVGPVETVAGTAEEDAARVYLRPETAQGIFLNFAHIQRSAARKVPFGIAQVGKAFRNEITPGNFIFRTREFEQMELEFFVKPPQFVREGEKTDAQWHDEWIEQRFNWWADLGIDASRIRKREQTADELAHYSKRTVDIEYLFPEFGWGEVEGVANRTDYDLTAHSRDVPEADLKRLKLEPNTDSVETFDYFDPDAKARYIPWVIEPSAGATRAMLAFLCEAYDEELVKQPDAAELKAIADEIPAVVKNALKKKKEAEKPGPKGPGVGDETAKAADAEGAKHNPALIVEFCVAIEDAAARLPESLLELDALLAEHPGAQNLEPVKKLRPRVSKLAEECGRVVLRLKPELAPIKVAVFPLKKNKPELVDIAKRIRHQLQSFLRTVYDDSAGIGKLYRRQDEIGTPWCITVDFDTLEDNTVTVRERDSMQQVRVQMEALKDYFLQRIHTAQ